MKQQDTHRPRRFRDGAEGLAKAREARDHRCLLTGHFGDALQTRHGQGHHDAQAGAHHQQAVADEQAGHRQPLVPCTDRHSVSGPCREPRRARVPASRLQTPRTWPQRARAQSKAQGHSQDAGPLALYPRPVRPSTG